MSRTHSDDWHIVNRARYAMEVVLRALREIEGAGMVVAQPFTCITAINPIIAAGHIPSYCDISEADLSLDISLLERKLNNSVRAVIVQHTFGMEARIKEIYDLLSNQQPRPLLVEDSAHRAGFIAKSLGSPLADVSIHSFGPEKSLMSTFGAAVWVNPAMQNRALYEYLVEAFQEIPLIGTFATTQAYLYPNINGVLRRIPNKRFATESSRLLAQSGIFRKPVLPKEQGGINSGVCMKLRTSQLENLLEQMDRLDTYNRHRLVMCEIYCEGIKNNERFTIPHAAYTQKVPLIRFPLLAKDGKEAEKTLNYLSDRGFYTGTWYRHLLFPGPVSFTKYNYRRGDCPKAEEIAQRIINLPTTAYTAPDVARKVVHELSR